MTPSLFWAGLLIGRAASPAILRRVSEAAPGVDQPVPGGRRSGAHPLGSSLDDRLIRRRSGRFGTGRRLSHHLVIFTRQFGRQASQLTGFVFVLGGMGGALIPGWWD